MNIFTLKEIDQDVILAKKGDGEAFARLIHKHKVSMYRVAKNILRNEQDIEDSIGDTILKAFTNISSLRRIETFKSWIISILVNQCYNILKKKNREVITDELANNAAIYEDKYLNFELTTAITTLDEDQRIVTILFYYEDMSLKEISKVLNIPEGTVKSRLFRAKKKLKTLIGD